ncbi:alpha/beta hydrolase fold domain-containing protein [Actinomycetospora callitridis]|uniref:alpha/beta hydrolase fold domain-containing protein n=1 Tax=Actinomycetospora callitridis TaxID=913944 RepID=UPI0023651560|nr:alpha/beta hydrolase fold domain-containing protein [Actinomycetospora callitridis]MDD7918878.1 alpha/beta hydrolase fold domain-containing protein [Actinomycetospora callitridis]
MSAQTEPAAEPALDPGIRALLDRWTDEPEMFDGTIDESRARFVTQMREAGGAPPREPELGEAGGVPVRTHRPATRTSDALVVFLHGGGWVLGGGDVYDAAADRLADDLGAVVAAVDYRLAPEHPFPAPLDDVLAAVRALVAHGSERYALVGDSAGANLAAVAALALRDEGRAPDALLLVYPPPDFEARYPSLAENAEGYWISARDVRACSKLYLAGHDPRGDARLSPLRAPSLAGLPPTIVATAGFDPLRDAGHAFADALIAAGVDARRREHPGLVHGFYGFTAVPAADAAVSALHAELAQVLA